MNYYQTKTQRRLRPFTKSLSVVFFTLFVLVSCDDGEQDSISLQVEEEFTYPDIKASEMVSSLPLEINQLLKIIEEKNTEHSPWASTTDYVLWSAIQHLESRVSIGIKPPNMNGELDNILYSNNNHMQMARDYTLTYIKKDLQKLSITEQDLNLEIHYDFPVITLTLEDFDLLSRLRQLPSVRYVEPRYEFDNHIENARISSGCGESRDHVDAQYVNFDGGAYRIPWNYYTHNIPEAWTVTKGEGVGIGIIDTGISPDQTLLNTDFNKYYPNRRIYKTWRNSKLSDPNDRCGHGTTIAGQIGAPINNKRALIGVANQSNLYSVRVGNGVVFDTRKEQNGVVEALRYLSNLSNVKIINISMGSLKSKDRIHDAIKQAYSRGKLIIAAAGISFSLDLGLFDINVNGIYPAKYNNEVLACTGSWYLPNNPGFLSKIDFKNFTGEFVDFAAYLRDKSNDSWGLGMRMAGFEGRTAVGSSSSAAIVSGIAALVWSARPSLTRAQVKDILIKSSSNYPVKDGEFGWGVIDAKKAVDLAKSYHIPLVADIIGQSGDIPSNKTYTWRAKLSGERGTQNSTTTYEWYWYDDVYEFVGNGPSYSRRVESGPQMLMLKVNAGGKLANKSILIIGDGIQDWTNF